MFESMIPDLDALNDTMSVAEIRQILGRTGWREIGVGDWSWVYAEPSDRWAIRVTPFDPAYRLHAEACRDGPPNRYLPRVDRIVPLRRDGYLVVMERLWPAAPLASAAFCAALGIENQSGQAWPADAAPLAENDDLRALRRRLEAMLADGARRFRFWGGSDIRPANVMADANGCLKLVDPVFIRGKAIVEAIAAGDRAALSDFSHGQLEDFLTIPPFKSGAQTDALRAALDRLRT